MYFLKNTNINALKYPSRAAAVIMQSVENFIAPGIRSIDIDKVIACLARKQNVTAATLDYKGFQKSSCISINNVVCHGIPSKSSVLNHGDIVNIDLTLFKDGYYGDLSKSFCVGQSTQKSKALVKIAEEALYLGINEIKIGKQIGNIGYIIQKHAEKYNYNIVTKYSGHGIGKIFHGYPMIYHHGYLNTNVIIREGMCFTVEPILNERSGFTYLLEDQWTIKTIDSALSAQFEHTVLVTRGGYKILTKL